VKAYFGPPWRPSGPDGRRLVLSRLDVRAFACEECGALAGERCTGVSGPRESNHQTRVNFASAVLIERRRRRR
jgi:hypothetical protein